MHLVGDGTGASGELLPISFGLGSSAWIGGNTGAPPPAAPDVNGRGECEFFVGLIPDRCTPCELCGGDDWLAFGVAAENDGYVPCIDALGSYPAVLGRVCPRPDGVNGTAPFGGAASGNPARGPTS